VRICFLMYHGSMYSGGQGVYLYYLTRELARLGHEVHVISGPPYPRLAPGVTLHRVDSTSYYRFLEDRRGFLARRSPWEFFYPLNFLELLTTRYGLYTLMLTYSLRALPVFLELHRQRPFDVVHDNQGLGLGYLAIRAQGVPLVATIHHPLLVDAHNAVAHSRSLVQKVRRLLFYPAVLQAPAARAADRIITVSRASAELVAWAFGVPREKVEVVYNGVDADTFRPLGLEREPRSIIYVGNSEDPNKGAQFLLEALHYLLREGAEFRLTLVDRPRAGLQLAPRLVRRYGLSTRVHFAGRLSTAALARAYNRSQLMACPSLYEGFGMPVSEAMACGTAVVATRGGALPEVVGEDGAGLLVPPGDARALAEAIAGLLADPQRCADMGQEGRRRVLSLFSWRKAALETLRVYERVLSGSG